MGFSEVVFINRGLPIIQCDSGVSQLKRYSIYCKEKFPFMRDSRLKYSMEVLSDNYDFAAYKPFLF